MKTIFAGLFLLLSLFSLQAQYQHHWKDDSTHSGNRPKMEKGAHKGPMFMQQGIKIEMVTPSSDKGNDVAYYVYDSLNRTLDTKLFSGTVKYVFGNSAEYLETKLISGTGNKYTATLEGWQEYKRAIVTLKSLDKTYTFSFAKPTNGSQTVQGHGGGHHHGGGQGHGNRQGLGSGMGGGESNSNSGY